MEEHACYNAPRRPTARSSGSPPQPGLLKLIAKILGWLGRKEIARNSPSVHWFSLNSVPRVLAAEEGHPLPGR
jgi:hypothetical protein